MRRDAASETVSCRRHQIVKERIIISSSLNLPASILIMRQATATAVKDKEASAGSIHIGEIQRLKALRGRTLNHALFQMNGPNIMDRRSFSYLSVINYEVN